MALVNRLFVYGTLLKASNGCLHPFLQDHADYLAEGCLPGKLFEIDGYPGAVLCQKSLANKVFGELYALRQPDLLLRQLDDYEECSEQFPSPHEYSRTQQVVTLADGRHACAWVYLYNHSTAGLQQIASGNYRYFARQ